MFGYRSNTTRLFGQNKLGPNTSVYGDSSIVDSLIYDSAEIYNSGVHSSSVAGNAKVIESSISDSHISGLSMIAKSKTLSCKMFDSSRAYNTTMVEVTMEGRSIISGGAVTGANLKDEAHVCGGYVYRWEEEVVLDGKMFIHKGIWNRAPLILYATLSDYTVQECVNGKIHINCTCNTIEKWLGGAGVRYGRMMGLNDTQVQEIEYLTKEMGKLIGK